MAQKTRSINLFRAQKKGLFDKFLDWSLTIGRLLVLLTETVALAMFVYRFSLDRQIIDLHDKIKQKIAIVTYLKTNEETYRDLQKTLSEVKAVATLSTNTPKSIKSIIEMAKNKVLFDSFNLSNNTVSVNVRTTSLPLLISFIQTLHKHPDVAKLTVGAIQSQAAKGEIATGVTIVLK